jgi:hypothetical protein
MTTAPVNPPPVTPPVAPAKPGVLGPWILVVLVLLLSCGVHLVFNPVSAVNDRLNDLINQLVQAFPGFLQGYARVLLGMAGDVGEFSVVVNLVVPAALTIFVVRPFVITLASSLVTHPLLFLTGGTDGGWRVTFRAFAVNRIFVELLTLGVLLTIAISPLPVSSQAFLLCILVPGVRLIGMGTLLAQVVRGQGINFFRTMFLLGPLFALTTIFSMLLSLVDVLWVGLWCVARVR